MTYNREKLTEIKLNLLKVEGVWGVGLGLKESVGKISSQLALRVYVEEKKAQSKISQKNLIPSIIEGIVTDVIQKTRTIHCSNASYIEQGSMIANSKGVPGTLGCFAYTNEDRSNVCLTNYHILYGQGGKEGEKIWYVNKHNNQNKYEELGKTYVGKIGTVKYEEDFYFIDCAVAKIINDNTSPPCLPFPFFNKKNESHTSQALIGSKVRKIGSASRVTEGIIIDVNYPDVSYFEGTSIDAPNQMLIRPIAEGNKQIFSAAGDSGSVIINEDDKIVGLLWGTNSKGEGIASHIFPILRELDISILSPPSFASHILLKGGHFCKSIINALSNFCGPKIK